jgi:hypothetical protein
MTEVLTERIAARRPEAGRPFRERLWLSVFLVVQLLWLSAVGFVVHWLAAL